MAQLLIEAEQFQQVGGWVVDAQFIDQMGSAFLLAHGLGKPVEDARTSVSFAEGGGYRLWVRTRDWVAPWSAPGAPGRFQVLINGKACPTVFGTQGAGWHWQDGGMVDVARGTVEVALHDLAGFEGRCDALLFCSDPSFVPPDGGGELAEFRRQALGLPKEPAEGGAFDLVVVGGGIAGTCAAVAAARLGLSVALVQDRPVLGGNNSSEVRVWLGGEVKIEPYPRVGSIVAELEQKKRAHYGPANTAELYEDDRKLALVRAERNITLMLSNRVVATEVSGGQIGAVIAQNVITGQRRRLAGRWFADCTGDAVVGYLAGADFEMTNPGHMGPCNLWNVKEAAQPTSFPRCPWALDLTDKPFPGRESNPGQYAKAGVESLGAWFWESGFSQDPIAEAEMIRDWNFRAMYGAWDALKNVDHVYPTHQLNWAAHIFGPRESRRLLGDVILSREDVMEGRVFPDACVPCTWSLDLHYPAPSYTAGFEGREFISEAVHTKYPRPYWAPYRCLYSRNIGNLFMAGRDVSVTHEALGTVRVMRTGGAMGEVVGMAAKICRDHEANPRGIFQDHLEELKDQMRRGI